MQVTSEMARDPFKHHPDLRGHILRMAQSGNVGSTEQWGAFCYALEAALSSIPAPAGDVDGRDAILIKAITNYRQADEEGIMVEVSRQACDEIADLVQHLSAENSRLTAQVERLEGERDEWKANSSLYEKTAQEAARGLECLSDIDEAWDAFGTAGNRGTLTLAEQISSTIRDAEAAEARADALGGALDRLLSSPVISDENYSDPAWGDRETAEAIAFARAARHPNTGEGGE